MIPIPFMPNEVVELAEKCQFNDHICAFYSSEEEKNKIAAHFLFVGLLKGEKVIYIDTDDNNNAIKQALSKLSVDVDSEVAAGQLSILERKKTYFALERFDQEHMLNLWKQSTDLAVKENYSGLRASGDVPCNDDEGEILDKILQYELELNNFFPENKALALCLYNRSLFPDEVLSKILLNHPFVMHKNTVCDNSFFVSPDLKVKHSLDKLLEQIWNQNKKEVKN
jgi:hypothetical protein